MIKIYAKELPTPAEAKNRGLVLVELPANCHLDGDVGQMRHAIDELAAIARGVAAHPPTSADELLNICLATERLQRLDLAQQERRR